MLLYSLVVDLIVLRKRETVFALEMSSFHVGLRICVSVTVMRKINKMAKFGNYFESGMYCVSSFLFCLNRF